MDYFFLLASSSSRYRSKGISDYDKGEPSRRPNYLGSTYLALTFVPSTELCVTEGLSGFKAALLFSDFTRSLRDGRRWMGQVNTGGGCFEVIALCGVK